MKFVLFIHALAALVQTTWLSNDISFCNTDDYDSSFCCCTVSAISWGCFIEQSAW